MAHSSYDIVGNRELIERIKCDVMSDTVSHAYIIQGPSGSGKHLLANYIALSLACKYSPKNKDRAEDAFEISMFDEPSLDTADADFDRLPCSFEMDAGLCPACTKVMEGKCPDIHIIGRDGKATIGVETIRNLKSEIHVAPIDMETKIYIIEDADTMTVQAQNALLLTLEEPPSYILFILLCQTTEGLLETIRSRATTFRTQILSDEVISNYLVENFNEAKALRSSHPSEFNTVVISADGRIGKALDLLDAKERKKIFQKREISDEFIKLMKGKKNTNSFEVLSLFPTKRDEALEILEYIKLALRDILLIKKSDNVSLKYYTDADIAMGISDSTNAKAIFTVINAVNSAISSLERNGNVKLTLTRMCIDAQLI